MMIWAGSWENASKKLTEIQDLTDKLDKFIFTKHLAQNSWFEKFFQHGTENISRHIKVSEKS